MISLPEHERRAASNSSANLPCMWVSVHSVGRIRVDAKKDRRRERDGGGEKRKGSLVADRWLLIIKISPYRRESWLQGTDYVGT